MGRALVTKQADCWGARQRRERGKRGERREAARARRRGGYRARQERDGAGRAEARGEGLRRRARLLCGLRGRETRRVEGVEVGVRRRRGLKKSQDAASCRGGADDGPRRQREHEGRGICI